MNVTGTKVTLISGEAMEKFVIYYCPLNFKDSKNVWLER